MLDIILKLNIHRLILNYVCALMLIMGCEIQTKQRDSRTDPGGALDGGGGGPDFTCRI